MGQTGDTIVVNGRVLRWSPFLGRYVESYFPAVDLPRHEILRQFLKGRKVFRGFTDEEYEMAASFDVNKALRDISEARESAGLPVAIDKK